MLGLFRWLVELPRRTAERRNSPGRQLRRAALDPRRKDTK